LYLGSVGEWFKPEVC